MRGDTLGKAEILTPRLRLRRFSMQDMSGFLLFAADADTMLRAGSKPVSTPAEAESELRRAADDPYAFAITLRETGEVMGKIKYQRDYCRYNTDSISIGYELSRRYRHNGYMTEALRAMVQNARVLVMDEPTANLDCGNSALVMERVSALAGEGFTVIFSTHDPNQAFRYATQVLALQGGGVLAAGRPEEALTSETLTKLYGVGMAVCPVTAAGKSFSVAVVTGGKTQ